MYNEGFVMKLRWVKGWLGVGDGLSLDCTQKKKKNLKLNLTSNHGLLLYFIICDTKFEQKLLNPCIFVCILDSGMLKSKQLITIDLQQ